MPRPTLRTHTRRLFRSRPEPADRAAGQAAVELVALLPLVALAAAAMVQVALVAHAAWAASQAAASAARAAAVGGDAGAAARAALPPHLERGIRLVSHGGGEIELRMPAPSIVPSLDFGTIAARGRFEVQT